MRQKIAKTFWFEILRKAAELTRSDLQSLTASTYTSQFRTLLVICTDRGSLRSFSAIFSGHPPPFNSSTSYPPARSCRFLSRSAFEKSELVNGVHCRLHDQNTLKSHGVCTAGHPVAGFQGMLTSFESQPIVWPKNLSNGWIQQDAFYRMNFNR